MLTRHRVALLLATGCLVAACSSGGGVATTTASSDPPAPVATSAVAPTVDAAVSAAVLCPVLWDWQKAIGAAFNDAAASVATISSPEERRRRWRAAFDQMEQLDRGLVAATDGMAGDTVLAPLVDDIRDGVDRSLGELEDLRTLLDETPQIDEERHQVRTQQLVVRVEKVIDVVKPELSDHDPTGSLVAAFRTVPSCQHAVKDVDDGTPRANG